MKIICFHFTLFPGISREAYAGVQMHASLFYWQAFRCLSPGFPDQHSHPFAGCQRARGASARRAREGLTVQMKWGLSNGFGFRASAQPLSRVDPPTEPV